MDCPQTKGPLLVAVRLHSPTDLSECFSAKYVDNKQNTLVSYKL